jgi:murein L,D-transpeptidase YafK
MRWMVGVVGLLGMVAVALLTLAGAQGRAASVAQPCPAPALSIRKAARTLVLTCDGRPRARFRVSLGRSPLGPKQIEGDGRTPEGDYYVCTRNERSSFRRFLGLSYPGPVDAERGLRERLISAAEAQEIVHAHAERRSPPWKTRLGGAVGIHGVKLGWGFVGRLHRLFDWTNGCIAIADDEIDELWDVVPLGTPVTVTP